MAEIDVKAIKERAEKASVGPWTFNKWKPSGRGYERRTIGNPHGNGQVSLSMTDADGDFIAHARTDIPDLLSALSDAEGIVREMAEELKWFYHVVHQSEEYQQHRAAIVDLFVRADVTAILRPEVQSILSRGGER